MVTEKRMMLNIVVARLRRISIIQNSKVQYAYGFVWKRAYVCDILKRKSSPMEMVSTQHTIAEVIERIQSTV